MPAFIMTYLLKPIQIVIVCQFQLTVVLEINLFYIAKILTGALCTVLLMIQGEAQQLLEQFLLGHPQTMTHDGLFVVGPRIAV